MGEPATPKEPRLALVVARGANGVIGADGRLPWRLADDLARFKAITMGKPILMGRKTWNSLPRGALPGRANLALSRDPSFRPRSAWAFSSLETLIAAARAMARRSGQSEICVIGGGDLYAQTLPLAHRLYLTEVEASPEGDARFPALDEGQWREVSRQTVPADPRNDHPFTLRVLDRRTAAV